MPPKVKTICIDFDAVIAKYNGWRGPGEFGSPVEGAPEYIRRLKADGWKIIIHTTRGEVYDLINYLDDYNIPYDDINRNTDNPLGTNCGKPFADIYLDDRAITFTGSWPSAFAQIQNFQPYYKRGE